MGEAATDRSPEPTSEPGREPNPPVLVVGAGPVGLSTALSLARAGVRSVVVERKTQLDPHSRATVILPRTLEILGQWGVVEPLVAMGNRAPHVRLREARDDHQVAHIDFTELIEQTATPYALAVSQDRVERVLLDAATATGLVEVCFDTELVAFTQDPDGVQARLRSGDTETHRRAAFAVGADGAHSRVRDLLGIELEGRTYPTQAMLADVRIDTERDRTGVWPIILGHRGVVVGIRFGDRVWRIIEQAVEDYAEPVAMTEHIVALARELFGTTGVEIIWHNVYHKHRRQAARFRERRVVLAGDAGHLNSPAGGQGMNSGIQDAHNLAWKLAAAIAEPAADDDALLESYSRERGGQVSHGVQRVSDLGERFQTARPHRRVVLVRALDALFGIDQSAGAMTSGFSMLTVAYDGSPLVRGRATGLGRRVPDALDVDGQRLYTRIPSGGILAAGEDLLGARRIAEALGLPLIDADVAVLTRFFDRPEFVALVRPDHIVGTVADLDHADPAQFAAALGRTMTGAPTSRTHVRR